MYGKMLVIILLGDVCMGVNYTALFTFLLFENVHNKKIKNMKSMAFLKREEKTKTKKT